jgi:MFS transporter, DHA2 family, methylenomycin A resistance protein
MRSAPLKFKPVSGTDTSRDSEAGPAPSKLATSLTLAAMSLGYGVVQLDVTIVNTALNAIGTSLGGGVAELQWVVGAYTIAFAAFILTAGALGDRIGSKRIFIAGFALFTAASVACALAPSAAILISARCVQGLAAAILVPNSLALLSHAYTDEKARGRAVGIWAAGASLALTAGPFVGGGLITLVGWRSIFLVNLPIGLAGLWLAWRFAGETTRSPQRGIDLPGQVTAVAALGFLAGAIIEGGALGWSSPFVIAGFAAFAICAALFVWRETRAPQPMLPLRLFKNRMFALTSLIGLLVNVAIYGLIFVLSLYFQQVNGLSAFETGLAFVPMMGAVLPVNLLAPPRYRICRRARDHCCRCGALRSRMPRDARHRGRDELLGDLSATDGDEHRPRIAGAAIDIDVARQRREIALGHRRRRAQRNPANRQRARRRLVRFVGQPFQCFHDRTARVVDDFGRRAARSRCGNLVGAVDRHGRPRRIMNRL